MLGQNLREKSHESSSLSPIFIMFSVLTFLVYVRVSSLFIIERIHKEKRERLFGIGLYLSIHIWYRWLGECFSSFVLGYMSIHRGVQRRDISYSKAWGEACFSVVQGKVIQSIIFV
jgi:hypothetical protein